MDDQNLRHYRNELQIIWDAMVRRDAIPEKVDAIVIGGCGDTGLAEPAAELFHTGTSDLIVISGYRPENADTTEAELLAGACMRLGVPENVLQLEKEASNTGENIRFSARMINDMKPGAQRIVLIHKPFMSLRFLATAQAQWPSPQPAFYATCQSISFDDYCKTRGLKAVAWEMLGDFKRMDKYVETGFQTKQNIPEAARAAFKRVENSGIVTR